MVYATLSEQLFRFMREYCVNYLILVFFVYFFHKLNINIDIDLDHLLLISFRLSIHFPNILLSIYFLPRIIYCNLLNGSDILNIFSLARNKYALLLNPLARSMEELLPANFSGTYGCFVLIRTGLVTSSLLVAFLLPYFGMLLYFYISSINVT